SAGITEQDAGALMDHETPTADERQSSPRAHAKRHRWLVIPAVALLVTLVALSGFMLRGRGNAVPSASSPVRFTLPYPDGTEAIDGAQFAVSPDGRNVVVAARSIEGPSRLWVRRLQAIHWQQMPDTDGAQYPFWSPDSRHIGFFADRRLKR